VYRPSHCFFSDEHQAPDWLFFLQNSHQGVVYFSSYIGMTQLFVIHMLTAMFVVRGHPALLLWWVWFVGVH
jgi:hypothetical protein